jgi:hypothetical protein
VTDEKQYEVDRQNRVREALSPNERVIWDYFHSRHVADGDLASAAEAELTDYYLAITPWMIGETLDPKVAIPLASRRMWAIEALLEVHGLAKRVKEIELQISNGAPLAICVGGACHFSSPPVAGRSRNASHRKRGQQREPHQKIKMIEVEQTVWLQGRTYTNAVRWPAVGCLKVFEDTSQSERVPWSSWCTGKGACAPNDGGARKRKAQAEKFLTEVIPSLVDSSRANHSR